VHTVTYRYMPLYEVCRFDAPPGAYRYMPLYVLIHNVLLFTSSSNCVALMLHQCKNDPDKELRQSDFLGAVLVDMRILTEETLAVINAKFADIAGSHTADDVTEGIDEDSSSAQSSARMTINAQVRYVAVRNAM
jgi:hypothetical protein